MCVESVTTRLAPVREHVESLRLHLHPFHATRQLRRKLRQMLVQKSSDVTPRCR